MLTQLRLVCWPLYTATSEILDSAFFFNFLNSPLFRFDATFWLDGTLKLNYAGSGLLVRH